MPRRQQQTTLIHRDDATAIVQHWMTRHPEIRGQIKGHDAVSCRELVLELLYPYDRFPSTLDQLVRLALSEVDWAHVCDGESK